MKVNIISKLHERTYRDYLARMTPDKPKCMMLARQFGYNFFDGERKYGYGGYEYDGRFVPVAKALAERYNLTSKSDVLDYGCAKGFLTKDLRSLIMGIKVWGYDISEYAKENAVTPIIQYDKKEHYDLIVSLGTLHNLTLPELKETLQMFEKKGTHKYITVDSYRNEQELFNLQCWTLTCECFFRPEEWEFLFKEWGYTGDWEPLFFT